MARQIKTQLQTSNNSILDKQQLQVVFAPIVSIKPNPRNARTHSKKQVGQLASSILAFRYLSPVVVDEDNVIINGHGRYLAAQQLGLAEVPVIKLTGLSQTQKLALALADNKIAANAGWDREQLAKTLAELGAPLEDIGLDIEITGFSTAEADILLGDLVDPEHEPADDIPALEQAAVSRRGDVWTLGKHRVLNGDARAEVDWQALMQGQRGAATITDPPYNVLINSVVGRGKTRHREFALASGEMTRSQFTDFLTSVVRFLVAHTTDGSVHYISMDWRHHQELAAAGRAVYDELLNIVVWVKSNAGQGSFYRSQHELIFVYRNGTTPHRNNVELGRHGRNRSNVWRYAGVNTFRAGRMDDLAVHPTVKPVAMVADAIRDCTKRGDIVIDAFMGSGTTILAAERVGRRAFGIEIDPLYVDVAVRRWQAFTGQDAILEATGQTFDEVAASRGEPVARRAS
jgi:DNA modification methylase